MQSLAFSMMQPIRHELEKKYDLIKKALEEEKGLDQFTKNWNYLEIIVEFFPHYSDTLFKFVFNHSEKFLNNWGHVRLAAKLFPEHHDKLFGHVYNKPALFLNCPAGIRNTVTIFPRYKNQLFNFTLTNANTLLNNWFYINTAIECFPEHNDNLRNYVFEHADDFLTCMGHIRSALEAFPKVADILQQPAVSAMPLFPSEADRSAIVAAARAAVREYLLLNRSYDEISKNAQLATQGVTFFKRLPEDICVEIAALTGAHEMKQALQIAQENYSAPSIGKRNA